MVKIQIEIPEGLDREIRMYMAQHNIKDKREAVIQILNKQVEVEDGKSNKHK